MAKPITKMPSVTIQFYSKQKPKLIYGVTSYSYVTAIKLYQSLGFKNNIIKIK